VPRKRLWIDGHVHMLRRDIRNGEEMDYFVVNDNNPCDVDRFVDDPDYLHTMNERIYREFVLPSGGRLFGSVQIDPRALKQSHEDLDLYLTERNFVQVGEVEGAPFGFDMDTPEMVELAQHAARLGAPAATTCARL